MKKSTKTAHAQENTEPTNPEQAPKVNTDKSSAEQFTESFKNLFEAYEKIAEMEGFRNAKRTKS